MFTVTFCTFVLSIYVAVFLAILQLTWPFFVYAAVIALMVLPVSLIHLPFDYYSPSTINYHISSTHQHQHQHQHQLTHSFNTRHLQVLVYHMQYILGNGTVRASLKDDKLAALLLFTDFLALFMLTFYWRPTRGDKQ